MPEKCNTMAYENKMCVRPTFEDLFIKKEQMLSQN